MYRSRRCPSLLFARDGPYADCVPPSVRSLPPDALVDAR